MVDRDVLYDYVRYRVYGVKCCERERDSRKKDLNQPRGGNEILTRQKFRKKGEEKMAYLVIS